jgi:hypothetical protein
VIGQDVTLARRQVVLALDPVEHFAGGLLGKGEQQDTLGGHALLAKAAVTFHQHPGLPGARTGNDQEGTGRVSDRPALSLVESRTGADHLPGTP